MGRARKLKARGLEDLQPGCGSSRRKWQATMEIRMYEARHNDTTHDGEI